MGKVIYASAAMMVSLGHPQTHVGERGEPSKFEKKFVQDSCTVYMILVHKPLTDGDQSPENNPLQTMFGQKSKVY